MRQESLTRTHIPKIMRSREPTFPEKDIQELVDFGGGGDGRLDDFNVVAAENALLSQKREQRRDVVDVVGQLDSVALYDLPLLLGRGSSEQVLVAILWH